MASEEDHLHVEATTADVISEPTEEDRLLRELNAPTQDPVHSTEIMVLGVVSSAMPIKSSFEGEETKDTGGTPKVGLHRADEQSDSGSRCLTAELAISEEGAKGTCEVPLAGHSQGISQASPNENSEAQEASKNTSELIAVGSEVTDALEEHASDMHLSVSVPGLRKLEGALEPSDCLEEDLKLQHEEAKLLSKTQVTAEVVSDERLQEASETPTLPHTPSQESPHTSNEALTATLPYSTQDSQVSTSDLLSSAASSLSEASSSKETQSATLSTDEEESKKTPRVSSSVTLSRDGSGRQKINQYSIIRKLGEGSFAKVKLAEFQDKKFAIKVFNKSQLLKRRDFITDDEGNMVMHSALEDVQKEIAVMKKLTHCNVVKLHEVIDDDRNDRMYLVLDFCANGPVLDWDEDNEVFVRPSGGVYDENEIRRMSRDMVCGLEFLHSSKIVHQDIKPQNILVAEDGQVKLADFGQARMVGDNDETAQSFGTYFFFAPEACTGDGMHSSKASDIWALGLCLYAMAYSKLPFYGDCLSDIFEQILTHTLEFPDSPSMSDDFKFLITRMLTKDPKQRIKMHELIQNPWVNHDAPPLQRSNSRPVEITQDDLANAIIPLRTVLLIKSKSKRWVIDAKRTLMKRKTL